MYNLQFQGLRGPEKSFSPAPSFTDQETEVHKGKVVNPMVTRLFGIETSGGES